MKNLLSIFILFPSFVFADVYLKCGANGQEGVRYVQIDTSDKEIELWEYFKDFGDMEYTYMYHLFIDLEITDKYYNATNKYFIEVDGMRYTWKNERGFYIDRVNKRARHTDSSKSGILPRGWPCESMNSIFFRYQVNALKNKAEKEHGPKF